MQLGKIKIYDDYNNFLRDLDKKINEQSSLINVGFINQHCYNLISDSPSYKKIIEKLDILLRDGVGIKIALILNKILPGINMNGTDLIPAIIKYLDKKESIFIFIGSEKPWVDLAAKKMVKQGQFIALDGFQSDEYYINFIDENFTSHELIYFIIGMGMPRQEILSCKIKNHLPNKKGCIINGGGIFDFVSERKKRAPILIRILGFEWLYRLLLEPKRMFNRYIIGIPKFLIRILIK